MHAATNKTDKYSRLTNTHIFETAGTWHHQAVELVKEIGKRTTNITGYFFQQMSIALQRGNAVSFQSTFTTG